MEKQTQIAGRNNFNSSLSFPDSKKSLVAWLNIYFDNEITTSESTRKVQRRDFLLFVEYFLEQTGGDKIKFWTPRLSKDLVTYLRGQTNKSGGRLRSDRTVNRILAHLKTFAKWVHKHQPFPLGNPTDKLKSLATTSCWK